MVKNFKQQMSERKAAAPRVSIPQIDPGAPKVTPAPTVAPAQPPAAPSAEELENQPSTAAPDEKGVTASADAPVRLAIVDTGEAPVNRGFHMYPTRHKQLRDLAYIEERKPWQVIEDALDEYVTRHYGKQHKRR